MTQCVKFLVLKGSSLPPGYAPLAGVALVSCGLLMTELALTRIFSVTMYYHFAFLAISIALFGLSASGVYVYLIRRRLEGRSVERLLARYALVFAATTVISLAFLVRLRVGLNYSPQNLFLMLAIYCLAAAPFFTGGAVISLSVTALSSRINLVYACDLLGAAAGCLLLLPLLDRIGAPGVALVAASLGAAAGVLFSPPRARARIAAVAVAIVITAWGAHLTRIWSFDVVDTKGHVGDRILFSKWNSFSRVAVYDRPHGDWSLSPQYQGALPSTRFMDIDSAASTPIVGLQGDVTNASYLGYELTALAYYLKGEPADGRDAAGGPAGVGANLAPPGAMTSKLEGADAAPQVMRRDLQGSHFSSHKSNGFKALVIGPGGGRDLVSALLFGAARVDGVEINPIIAHDVMLDRFREFSGGIYAHPRVRIAVEDGRSFVRRSSERYDVIQASLIDTWAATAAGAYTLTENSLYTVEAFNDYLDHLSEDGVLTVTRWVFDGLRLVSLAQEVCARRGCDAAAQLAVVQHDRVATFLFKRSPFTGDEIRRLAEVSDRLRFTPLYLPGQGRLAQAAAPGGADGPAPGQIAAAFSNTNDYARLILAPDRWAFYRTYALDVTPTTDDRPFFFHTTKLEDQSSVAFGRAMLFGNGLSALMTLIGISAALGLLFVIAPLALSTRERVGHHGLRYLAYFGCLGAGFMLIEVALLQRFVLLLGHPVYSLTVTLFSLLLGTGIGSLLSRRVSDTALQSRLLLALGGIILLAALSVLAFPAIIERAIAASRAVRLAVAILLLLPSGIVMGVPLPAGIRLLTRTRPALVPWAWGINGALSVLGATLAVFIAMNWGFSVTLLTGATVYATAAGLVVTMSGDRGLPRSSLRATTSFTIPHRQNPGEQVQMSSHRYVSGRLREI